ncbi:hypothetical protein RRSWK_01526 [Rhodopirellula sp. SWK7]|nr:hypothetical protein RRSWK_01526 [Rhodopirellula sp. SWK7]
MEIQRFSNVFARTHRRFRDFDAEYATQDRCADLTDIDVCGMK